MWSRLLSLSPLHSKGISLSISSDSDCAAGFLVAFFGFDVGSSLCSGARTRIQATRLPAISSCRVQFDFFTGPIFGIVAADVRH